MRRLFEFARRTPARPPSLRTTPFELPKDSTVLANYLVSYEVPAKSGIGYKGSFSVYIYESDGRWVYAVKEPYLDPSLSASVAQALESLSTWLAPSPVSDLDPIGYLMAELERSGVMAQATKEEIHGATHYLVRDILGYGLLDPLIRDPEIEDVSCEGSTRPVKVWHRRFNSRGWLESNLVLGERDSMDATVSRLVHRSGRSISTYSPIVDSVLPEGYRLAATWGKEVTSLGSSFIIRKQRAEAYTVPELVRAGTMSPSVAAYLWTMLDLKGFVVISGVTASGKTTLLNALASLLNPAWKIVSIEDTREISLPHSGWKPLHTRTVQGGASIGLFELVKLSLRERPDFVILGEARGTEVQALFQSAAAGSGCVTTFHSPNVESMVARLTQPPLSVSPSILNLIDAIVFMTRSPDGAERRVSQVVEMGETPVPLFTAADSGWEGAPQQSIRLGQRSQGYGYGARRLQSELDRRVAFIEGAVGKGVTGYDELGSELRRFYASSSATF